MAAIRRSRAADRRREETLGRVTLRLVALLTALVFVLGAAAPALAGKGAQASWTGTYNLYRRGVFATQYTWTWCVGASSQAMLNIIKDTSNTTKRRQRKLVEYAMAHDQFVNSNRGGSDAVGWSATLRRHGGGDYQVSMATSYRVAVRRAAKRMRSTGSPVGLLVMGGRHAWVMTGFDATADPARTNRFDITGVYVLGPLYPKQQRGFFDMPPNSRISWSQFKKPFRRFDDPDSPDFVGYWVTVTP
jgi:hypothetical protein